MCIRDSSYSFQLKTVEYNPPWYTLQEQERDRAHKGDTVSFNVYWHDDYNLDKAILSINYTNHSGGSGWRDVAIYDLTGSDAWANISYQLPLDMQPGKLYWKQYANDSFSNINVSGVLNITVWGWSGIDIISLNPANIQITNTTIIKCHVVDMNDSWPLEGYTVYFYNSTGLLGTNTTLSDGWAYYSYTDNTEGDENITCKIYDNAAILYNASPSANNKTALLHTVVGADSTPPSIVNNNYGLNDTSVKKGESLLIYAQWDESINSSYVLMNTTSSIIEQFTINPPYPDNWTNYTIITNASWIVGRHVAKIVATDQAGNTNNTLEYLWFNVTATSRADWYSPTGTVPAGIIILRCKITEEESGWGIENYPVYFYDPDNNLIGSNYTNSNGIASISYDASSLQGYNTFSCRIYSQPEMFYYIGFHYSDSQQLYIDGIPPNIVLNYPDNGAIIEDPYVDFNWTATDDSSNILSCNLTLNGIIRATLTCTSGTSCNQTLHLATGTYNWNVTCTDEYGHINTSETRTLTITTPDTNPPNITLISPENGTVTSNTTILFWFNVSDESSIDHCDLLIDGVVNNTKTTISQGLNNITGSGLGEGYHNWSVRCVDYYSNIGYSNESVIIIDLTPPAVFNLLSPSNGTVSTNTTPTLSWEQSADAFFDYYRVEISNSSSFAYIYSSIIVPGVDNTSINVSVGSDGEWWWRVIAVDIAGNEMPSSEAWIYITDNTPPIVSLLAPPDNDTDPDGNITFYYSLTDANPDTCYLYTNYTGVWQIDATDTAVTSGWNSFQLYNIPMDTIFVWNVKCVDAVGFESFAPNNRTVRVTNVTTYYQNITLQTNATVNNTPGYVTQIIIDSPVNLIAGGLTTITCNATIQDDNGVEDLLGARAIIYSSSTSFNAPNNATNHYTNDSCSCTPINDLQMACTCKFNVYYFADNGSWNCRVTALSIDGNSSLEQGFVINPLAALTVNPYVLDYGNVGAGQISNDRWINITNLGNIAIDLYTYAYAIMSDDELAMNCTTGNITTDKERFYYTSGQSFDLMIPIGNYSSMSFADINLSRQTSVDLNSSMKLYFKISVPDIVSGVCSGHIVMIATGDNG